MQKNVTFPWRSSNTHVTMARKRGYKGDEIPLYYLNKNTESGMFCYMAIPIKSSQSITNFQTAGKIMPYHISPNGSAGGCFLAMPLPCGISSLTCTIFDPVYFGNCRWFASFTFPQQGSNFSLWVTTPAFVSKWHTGATQAHTRSREPCFVCLKSRVPFSAGASLVQHRKVDWLCRPSTPLLRA